MKKETEKAVLTQQLALNPHQLAIVGALTPQEFIKTRVGRGGKNFRYVEGGYVINQLNKAFSPVGWDFVITDRIVELTEVVVVGKLTIKDHKGHEVCKTQFGQAERHKGVPLGDTLKSAATDCLKKASSLLGIALDVYWGQLDQIKPEPIAPKRPTNTDYFKVASEQIEKSNDLTMLAQLPDKILDSKLYTAKQKQDLIQLINGKIKGT